MLSQAQQNLHDHFRKLSSERASLGFPVYAIEHGLPGTDIEAIRDGLIAELQRTRELRSNYWLLWTVVAAEIGYAYDGDEYWDSFQSEIRSWEWYGSRDTIRDWYKRFAKNFTGFVPSGRWADHFSIIAWPITHSILPQYLHSHFARHLYDLRHEIAGVSLDRIGTLLEKRYHGGSSRFENFLQQTALTARLVLAMRDEDVQDFVGPIYRPTLARIIADLERKTLSRGYLRDARRVLRDARVTARLGLSGGRSAGSSEATSSLIKTAARGLKLVCRPTSDGSWNVGMAIPDLTAFLAELPDTHDALGKARIRFVDRDGGWMPAKALLSYSGREQILHGLPQSLDDPLIQFDKQVPVLAAIADELKILSRPPWLLKEHQDGVCRQMLGNNVRTGERYVIAVIDEIAPITIGGLNLQRLDSKTRGINLYGLEAPKVATQPFLQALSALSLGYVLRARVDPVGLVPRWNSSLGSSIWLPTEDVLLRLSADFDVSEFAVRVDGQVLTRFPISHQKEIIVSLGNLALGQHIVEITASARSQNASHRNPNVAPEVIFVEVRPPVPWQQGIQQKAGIRAILEPVGASLESLVSKKASIIVHGPAERSARVEARLFDASGHVTETSELGRIDLPSTGCAMARVLERFGHEPLSEKVQSAPQIDIAFIADELGASALSFSHFVPPLRWKLSNHRMRLIDEAGVGTELNTLQYRIVAPDECVRIQSSQCIAGVEIEPPGSLFIAIYQGTAYGAVASVPPHEKISGFEGLAVIPILKNPGDSPRDILRLIPGLRLWIAGRALLGPLAAIRKAAVIDVFEYQIERLACGTAWADRAKKNRAGDLENIEELQHQVGARLVLPHACARRCGTGTRTAVLYGPNFSGFAKSIIFPAIPRFAIWRYGSLSGPAPYVTKHPITAPPNSRGLARMSPLSGEPISPV